MTETRFQELMGQTISRNNLFLIWALPVANVAIVGLGGGSLEHFVSGVDAGHGGAMPVRGRSLLRGC